ncbi:hypothetical protein NEMBOFW57_002767 [Staphylotrichum longicolle]|uniref:Glucose-methanol-choline oxidoreductase N-terminal domain-containing protein n=1 Tax=Staphylotrichum longicolle TaxID=669026 RepID=A0AAD4I522_9PEZI|nr:hypothetical protein NEMBOFW57_002767 [Staphylotrichum longicolle]
MRFTSWLAGLIAFSPLIGATSHTTRNVKRQASQLLDSYDFVIAGGGTSGLTVADRLTEAFPDNCLGVEWRLSERLAAEFNPKP